MVFLWGKTDELQDEMVRQHTEWFTEKNISGIVGWGKRNPPELVTSVQQIIENRRTELTEIMQVTGFSPSNISSICAQAGEGLNEAITALYEKRERIKEIQNETGLSPDNLSSILHSSGKQVKEAVEALEVAEGTLATLLKRSRFAPSNLSAMLNGAGEHLPEALEALGKQETKDTIRALQFLGFSPTNISSMLSGAGEHLGDALTAVGKPETLGYFVQIFSLKNRSGEQMLSADNVAAMLHGSREHIGKAICDLNAKKDILKEIIESEIVTANNAASILAGSGSHISQAIDELSKCLPVLKAILDCGQFTSDTLACTLYSSRHRIRDVLDILSHKWEKVEAISEGFSATQLTFCLRKTPGVTIGKTVEDIYTVVEPFLKNESTTLRPGNRIVKGRIVDGNPMALRDVLSAYGNGKFTH